MCSILCCNIHCNIQFRDNCTVITVKNGSQRCVSSVPSASEIKLQKTPRETETVISKNCVKT